MTPTPNGAEPEVEVDVIVEDPAWDALSLPDLATGAAAATLKWLGIDGPAGIAVLATSDAAVARLNADHRGKAQPTNVLSWPAVDLAPDAPGRVPPPPAPDATGEMFLGDIALAYGTCAAEADAGGKPLTDHATHLVVHAILHLLGYDHISERDAVLMEGLEADILKMLGVPDPYREAAAGDTA